MTWASVLCMEQQHWERMGTAHSHVCPTQKFMVCETVCVASLSSWQVPACSAEHASA